MLRKLMKYEIKATGRIMIPLYLILLAASVALSVNIRLTTNVEGANHLILSTILIVLFVLAVALVAVVSSVLILIRFYRNLLGDEGYLMFSLPVTTLQNILSKSLTALFWIIASVLAGGLCGILMICIVGDISEFGKDLWDLWNLYILAYGRAQAVLYLILLILTIIISIQESILKVYAAISTGHLWTGHKLAGSILAYMGFSAIEMALSFLLNKTFLRNLFVFQEVTINTTAKNQLPVEIPLFFPILLISAVGLVIYGAISWIILDKKLNLV